MSSTPRGASAGDGSTSSFGNYDIDWRSVFAGGWLQALVVGVLYYFGAPALTYVVGVVAGATLAAGISRNYRDEAIDAGLATALGTAFSLVTVVGAVYVGTLSLPLGLQADLMLAIALRGGLVVSVTGVLAGFAGAIVGYVVAHYRERWRLRKEFT